MEDLGRTRGREEICDLLVLIRPYVCDMAPLWDHLLLSILWDSAKRGGGGGPTIATKKKVNKHRQ